MADQEMSPARTRAFYLWREAEQQAAKGHVDQAIGKARDALQEDPAYLEVRHWIAQQYEKAGLPRKAAAEYQDIIHQDHDDEEAWGRLRTLDPQTAERLERLQHIAPDPFVAQRDGGAELGDDLEDLATLAGDAAPRVEEPFFAIHDPGLEQTDSLEDITDSGVIQPVLGAEAGDWGLEPSPAEADVVAEGPPGWLFEDDLQHRELMARDKFVAGLLPQVVDFWNDLGTWDTSITGVAHLDKHRHAAVFEAFEQAVAVLGTEHWTLFFSPERRMVPTVLRGVPPVISVTTGMMNSLKPEELLFAAGRATAMLKAGHVPYLQVSMLVLDRTPRTITDTETDLIELLRRHHSGIVGLHRDERQQLSGVCHAWQLRAELSADRGGLVCCRDLDVACNGIAKGACPDANAAAMMTWRGLREKLQGQDLNQMIAIGPKEDPIRNEGYAFYRIRMLRWWAGTEPGQRLLGLA